jgi:hypothetical protein
MLLHASSICSAVKADDTFWTQSGKFLTRLRVSQNTKWQFHCLLVQDILSWTNTSLFVCSSRWAKQYPAGYLRILLQHSHSFQVLRPTERQRLHQHNRRRYWLLVRRWTHRGVSNRVKCVVKKRTSLRTKRLGFRSFKPNTEIHTGLPLVIISPHTFN